MAGQRVDPEAQAGRALRRLRLSRNWSQEEVAVRMTAYGYDFHQTTIAKIEAAQRPLRVRELADFAALYSVEVQDLVYAPTRSLPEIDQEIADVTVRLAAARAAERTVSDNLESARVAVRNAEAAYQASAAEVAVLEGRLSSLAADREKLLGWEPSYAEGGDDADRSMPEPVAASITSAARGGPVVRRMILGAQLRRLREANGITTERAAHAIRGSSSRINRLEMGRVGFKERDVADLLDLYGVTGKDRHELLELSRKSHTPGWWHVYSDILPRWFDLYIELEMAAAEIRAYEAQLIPDLLQTEDYSRAVTPWDNESLSARDIERKEQVRTSRRARFLDWSNPPNLRVILDEAALRRQVGGPTVMLDQLRHLAEIAERPNITVQVLPLQTGGDSTRSFKMLRFAEPGLPEVVFVEQLTDALYLDKDKDVELYRKAMHRLGAKALTPHQTTLFLRKLLDA